MKVFAITEEDGGEPVLLTPWSLVHFAVGGAAKELGFGFITFELLHLLYEVKDVTTQNNSPENSFGDQVVATVGHLMATRKGRGGKWTAAAVVGALLGFTFQDLG